MTPSKFRSLALSISGAVESAHMNHPDFRLQGRIFATLAYPDDQHGMVKLTPAQQKQFIQDAPQVFTSCSGAWGRSGATAVHLPSARVPLIRSALQLAAGNLTANTISSRHR